VSPEVPGPTVIWAVPIIGVAAITCRLTVVVSVPPAFVAARVNVDVPAVVGVPDSTADPVVASAVSVRPSGSAPDATLITGEGLPAAAKRYENGIPTCAVAVRLQDSGRRDHCPKTTKGPS
jgi:hypothetical protein